MLVATLGPDVIGLLDFLGGAYSEDAHAGVFGVSVASAYRGQGIGTALIGSLMEWAPAHGILRVEAHAWSNNPGSIRLYERLGFVVEGVRSGAIMFDGQAVDVSILARSV